MARANEWLCKVRNIAPVSCEVLEIDGTYNISKEELTDSLRERGTDSGKGLPAFLRILRWEILWF